jgi:deoxycytidylate deaminase
MSAVLSASENPAANDSENLDDRGLLKKFGSRASAEIVIAFAGPVGCGIASVVNATEEALTALGYTKVIKIKLSEFLAAAIADKRVAPYLKDPKFTERFLRYRELQQAGLELRERTENQAILAEYAIRRIFVEREKLTSAKKVTGAAQVPATTNAAPDRVAYLIDQVKRPEEVVLLRALYRNLFYLIGVHKNYDGRLDILQNEGIRTEEAKDLVEIDRNENAINGQKLDKTLHLAEYFVRNDSHDSKAQGIERFLRLIHGDKKFTPTAVEQGMYAAYSAGLRSACLSRQVGAAIASADGEIIATGCNDVPRAGGGLYSADSPSADMRCIHKRGGTCFNDEHKQALHEEVIREIERVLAVQISAQDKPLRLSDDRRKLLSKSVYENTKLKDLGEFSRSVHAEMDAIVSLARSGTVGIRKSTLFTTTFPCHSCARHIVAAGIESVYYIEPYEKSLAEELHGDDISFESNSKIQEGAANSTFKVKFLHFEGVAPRRFSEVFNASGRKDKSGKFIEMKSSPDKTMPEYIDNYFDFETKAIAHLEAALLKAPPQKNA